MYELVARNRETKRYDHLKWFEDERQFYFMLDQVDSDKYYEAMILQGQSVKMYVELKQKVKIKTR